MNRTISILDFLKDNPYLKFVVFIIFGSILGIIVLVFPLLWSPLLIAGTAVVFFMLLNPFVGFLTLWFVYQPFTWAYSTYFNVLRILFYLLSLKVIVDKTVVKRERFNFVSQDYLIIGLAISAQLYSFPYSLTDGIQNLFILFAMSHFALSEVVDSYEKFKAFFWMFVFMGLMLGSFGLYEFYSTPLSGFGLGSELVDEIIVGGKVMSRPRGLSGNLALNLQLSIIFALYLFYINKSIKQGMLILAIFMIVSLAWVLASVRGSLVSLVVLFFYILIKRGRISIVVFASLMIFLVSIVVSPTFVIDFFKSLIVDLKAFLAGETTSLTGRVDLIKAGWEAIKAHPIVGVGDNISVYLSMGSQVRKGLPIHTPFVSIPARMGVIGGLMYFSLIWFTLRDLLLLRKLFEKEGFFKWSLLAEGLLVNFLGLLILFLVSVGDFYAPFYLIISLTVALKKLSWSMLNDCGDNKCLVRR